MPRRTLVVLASLTCAAAPAGCADGGGPSASGPSRSTAARVIGLGERPTKPGELYFTGDSSPTTTAPFGLAGRYLVRFEQIAPEDPNLDFSRQVRFTASLQRRAGDPSGEIKLFGAAARSGSRELRLSGRFVLEVSFGDFPYGVRFTPRR